MSNSLSDLQAYSIIQGISEKINKLEKDTSDGIPTGFEDLDRLLHGLQKESLIVIGGKSIGKTTLALCIGSNVATKTDTCVSYFSLASNQEQITNRLLGLGGNINVEKIRRNLLSAKDYENLTIASGTLSQSKFYIIDDPIINVQEIEHKVRALRETHPETDHLVTIDYLSMIEPEEQQNRYEQTDYIVKKLKIMARQLKCPVILIVNLSRSYDRRVASSSSASTRPQLSDLRDSGTIEEDADVILFLFRENVYDYETESKGIAEIIVAKNRNGLTGTIELAYVGEYSKFVNLIRK